MPMLSLLRRIALQGSKWTLRLTHFDTVTHRLLPAGQALTRIGSKMASWYVPTNLLGPDSICYLAGAGEDISFDTEISAKYHCRVATIDPTPRALAHFLASCPEADVGYCSRQAPVHFFVPVGVWSSDTTMKFYAPRDPAHVSHSIVNLQTTSEFFEAECLTLQSIARRLGDSHIDLLKLDIEGAEIAVLLALRGNGILPSHICVEFDEITNPLDSLAYKRIRNCVQHLEGLGYQLVHRDFPANYSFALTSNPQQSTS